MAAVGRIVLHVFGAATPRLGTLECHPRKMCLAQ